MNIVLGLDFSQFLQIIYASLLRVFSEFVIRKVG